MYLRPGIFLWLLFSLPQSVWAQEDSVRYLQEIEIRDIRTPVIAPTGIPVQKFNAANLSKIQAIQLSDVIKRFAGIQVKDYGGIGGLKTVSVRGLGANHTAFSYNGITVNDSQTGQADLGKYSVGNLEEITLAIGNPQTLLLPARAFASGSVIDVKTAAPEFSGKERVHGTLTLKGGSFGFFAPLVIVQNKLNDRLSTSSLAEWQYADGHYPYTLDYGGSTSRQKRSNTDVNILHLEQDVFLKFNNDGRFTTKVYYYTSERGLPGATIFYNPHSAQRLWDENFFIQTQYEKQVTEKFETLFSAKYTTAHLCYLDPDYLGTAGKLDNRYTQEEFYVSAAGTIQVSKTIQLAISTDAFHNSMDANLYRFPYPSRFTSLTALQATFKNKYVDVQLGAVATLVTESTKKLQSAEDRRKLSPSVSVGYRPFKQEDFLLRFFYKDVFRMPTFNDLYYSGSGNANLSPENARQLNAGVVYTALREKNDLYVSISGDVYHNRVTDKIVALPTKNLFIWSMMNLGIVNVNGLDIALRTGMKLGKTASISLESAYTFQHVVDKTDPESKTYNHQLAYTPVHSGSASFTVSHTLVDVSYNLLFSGERYTLNHNIAPNYMRGYAEHGLTVSKKFNLRALKNSVSLEALNVFDAQYEVVKNFPMPGRYYRASLIVKF